MTKYVVIYTDFGDTCDDPNEVIGIYGRDIDRAWR